MDRFIHRVFFNGPIYRMHVHDAHSLFHAFSMKISNKFSTKISYVTVLYIFYGDYIEFSPFSVFGRQFYGPYDPSKSLPRSYDSLQFLIKIIVNLLT